MANNTHTFLKMNGLGNDFAVFDARASGLKLDEAAARRVADRNLGVGCDQVILIETSDKGDAFMRILNADGTEVEACGNAARCVAALLASEKARLNIVIETGAGLLACSVQPNGVVTVDMGAPHLEWNEIPLSRPFSDTANLDVSFDGGRAGVLERPAAVNVGNPHCVFVVKDSDAFDLAEVGPRLERDPLFPERANISLAEITGADRVKLRVWERGAGLTRACGTAACAAAVATVRKGLTERLVSVALPGGDLRIEWRETDSHVLMTGPWALDYEAVFEFGESAFAG